MIHRLLLICLVAVSGFLGASQLARGQSAALYPDLFTEPPSGLFFDKLGDGTFILRFNNTVRNLGPGRLEIQGNPKPPKKREPTAVRDIYQNLYDAPVGGTQVAHLRVHADTIYHAGHHHFHFANFAEYLLVKQDGSVQKQGSKTSFCIMDTTHFTGSFAAQYQSCGGELQGLTTGWGDTYDASLVDQWVVLGKNRLADGEYTLQSTADPGKKLVEADETNNIAVTSFTVSGGGQIITIH